MFQKRGRKPRPEEPMSLTELERLIEETNARLKTLKKLRRLKLKEEALSKEIR